MIRPVILTIIGVPAFASTIALATAPLSLIYIVAFGALAPISGVASWRVFSSFRHAEAIGALTNNMRDASGSTHISKTIGPSRGAISLPFFTPHPLYFCLGSPRSDNKSSALQE
jgi:hypothetical protein